MAARGEQVIAWRRAHGRDPREKLLIFAVGMGAGSIAAAYRHFHGRFGDAGGQQQGVRV